jgi:AraC family L-rhamnose operon regulatory protein RhaS
MKPPASEHPPLSRKDQAAKIAWINRSISTAHVGIGEVRYKPEGIWRPYTQRYYELAILHSGSCTVTVDDETCEMELGLIYIFFPGHRQHSRFSRTVETHHSWCKVKLSHMPQEMRDALERGPRSAKPSPIWLQMLKTAMDVGATREKFDLWAINFLALALFAEFLRCESDTAVQKRPDEAVRKAIAWMNDHLGEDDCLAQAQRASGLSPNSLLARFHASLGITPARYLWKLRAERGISMLKEGGLRVHDIAYHCGFKNPFHFSRMVRNLQGIPPREIRAKSWKGQDDPPDLHGADEWE